MSHFHAMPVTQTTFNLNLSRYLRLRLTNLRLTLWICWARIAATVVIASIYSFRSFHSLDATIVKREIIHCESHSQQIIRELTTSSPRLFFLERCLKEARQVDKVFTL